MKFFFDESIAILYTMLKSFRVVRPGEWTRVIGYVIFKDDLTVWFFTPLPLTRFGKRQLRSKRVIPKIAAWKPNPSPRPEMIRSGG